MYYDNNVVGTVTLLEVMEAHRCKKIVLSSSAIVYGWPKVLPCTEDFPLSAASPYGRTKVEKLKQMLLPKGKDGPVRPVMRTYYDHLQPVNDVDFHPQNPILIYGAKDNVIKFF